MRPRRKPPYFPDEPGSPEPLVATARRTVRFEDVDSLRMAWHGRYPSYFEDGREAFGAKYGLSYLDMFRNGFVAPLVQLHVDYHAPLEYRQTFDSLARLKWTETAKLYFEYEIRTEEGTLCATGYSTQMLTDLERQPLYVRPPYLEEFWKRWEAGALK